MTWLWKWLADFPSTNGRIFVTIALSVGTAVRYWSSETWKPSYEWLAFLIVMAGLDVAQFGKKRDTFQAVPPTGKDIEDTPSKPTVPKTSTAETLGKDQEDTAGTAAPGKIAPGKIAGNVWDEHPISMIVATPAPKAPADSDRPIVDDNDDGVM